MFPPGPAFDRDQAGTSFAAPKVTRIAAYIQAALPDEPALLYRALIVQSARWPVWAEAFLAELRQEWTGTPATDAEMLAGANTKVHGEVVKIDGKKPKAN